MGLYSEFVLVQMQSQFRFLDTVVNTMVSLLRRFPSYLSVSSLKDTLKPVLQCLSVTLHPIEVVTEPKTKCPHT